MNATINIVSLVCVLAVLIVCTALVIAVLLLGVFKLADKISKVMPRRRGPDKRQYS